jgi:hypothetical protein
MDGRRARRVVRRDISGNGDGDETGGLGEGPGLRVGKTTIVIVEVDVIVDWDREIGEDEDIDEDIDADESLVDVGLDIPIVDEDDMIVGRLRLVSTAWDADADVDAEIMSDIELKAVDVGSFTVLVGEVTPPYVQSGPSGIDGP